MRYQCLLVLLVTNVGYCSTAFSWGGKLDAPLFGYHQGLDADQQKKAQIALMFMHEELKFIGGEFITTRVINRFGGTSLQTSRFIKLLKDAKSWKVGVQFQDFGEQQTAFTLYQNMVNDTVTVTVNSGREDFKLRDFRSYLPKAPLHLGSQ